MAQATISERSAQGNFYYEAEFLSLQLASYDDATSSSADLQVIHNIKSACRVFRDQTFTSWAQLFPSAYEPFWKLFGKDWFGVYPETCRHLPSDMLVADRSGTEIYHIKPLGFGDVVRF